MKNIVRNISTGLDAIQTSIDSMKLRENLLSNEEKEDLDSLIGALKAAKKLNKNLKNSIDNRFP